MLIRNVIFGEKKNIRYSQVLVVTELSLQAGPSVTICHQIMEVFDSCNIAKNYWYLIERPSIQV